MDMIAQFFNLNTIKKNLKLQKYFKIPAKISHLKY